MNQTDKIEGLVSAFRSLLLSMQTEIDKLNNRCTALERAASTTPHQQQNTETERMSTVEAAKYLQLKPSTLEVWRFNNKGPAYLKVGRLVQYRKADLEQWINSRQVSGESNE
jgi:excisionase family DNA binding protein